MLLDEFMLLDECRYCLAPYRLRASVASTSPNILLGAGRDAGTDVGGPETRGYDYVSR